MCTEHDSMIQMVTLGANRKIRDTLYDLNRRDITECWEENTLIELLAFDNYGEMAREVISCWDMTIEEQGEKIKNISIFHDETGNVHREQQSAETEEDNLPPASETDWDTVVKSDALAKECLEGKVESLLYAKNGERNNLLGLSRGRQTE